MHRERRPGARRIAVVDLGTNSTRLLVGDVARGAVTELERRTNVTRLGQGVDASGRLANEAVGRVLETLAEYREAIDRLGAERVVAVATSAVRDAQDGPAFLERVAEEFNLEARTISGEEEARLTFRGATAERAARAGGGAAEDAAGGAAAPETVGGTAAHAETMVVDIGGGSTEYVVGRPGSDPEFHISARLGSVRHTERHLNDDPPAREQVAGLAEDVRRTIAAEIPADVRQRVTAGIAVAGTATSLAAIDQELEPYDPARVHGYRLPVGACQRILVMLAALPLGERRQVPGLHPDRAPTIVAGAAILLETLRGFGLDEIEISEADILHGAALAATEGGVRTG